MATTKKYVSLEKLGLYDEKIKGVISTGDSTTLESAKAYADEKDSAIAAAKKAGDDAQTTANEAVTKADAAQAAADKAQGEVDDLEVLVGTIPETAAATDVIGYINEKTANIATDSALNDLSARVGQAESDIDGIQADYLKAADKTELSNAIAAEKTRAEGIESGLRTDVDAIKVDYLKAADKAELQGSIDGVQATVTTLVGSDSNKSVRAIANEELAKQLIADGAAESLNELHEIAAWIQSHPNDASAMNQAIADLEALIGELPSGITATDIVGYIQEVVAAEQARAEQAEGGLSDRITALEGAVGNGGSVEDMIADAVDTAIGEEQARVDGLLDKKVDKVDGKGLSTNDLTNDLKAQYDAAYTHSQAAHAPSNAQANIIESVKVNGVALEVTGKAVDVSVPTDNAQLTNGAGYLVASDIAGKAEQTALQGEIDRATAKEAELAAAIGAFTECSEDDINNLFQQ